MLKVKLLLLIVVLLLIIIIMVVVVIIIIIVVLRLHISRILFLKFLQYNFKIMYLWLSGD